MSHGADTLPLDDDVDQRADDGDEIQRQIQQRPDPRPRRELMERPPDQFPQPGDGVMPGVRLQLPAVGDERVVTLGDQRAVEGVDEGVVEQEGPRQRAGERRALAQHQQRRGEGRERTGCESQHGHLRHIREEEQGRRHAHAEGDRGADPGEQRFP